MSTHPKTPMTESDLRRHLGKQTSRSIGLVDIRNLTSCEEAVIALRETCEAGDEIVVLDSFDMDHLRTVGELLWKESTARSDPLFCVGSSGLEHNALTDYWAEIGYIDPDAELLKRQPAVERIAVMSGSVAPTTASQIEYAQSAGFETIQLDTPRLIDPAERESARTEAVSQAVDVLTGGKSVVLYSAKEPNDTIIERTRHRYSQLEASEDLDQLLGQQQGRILYDVLNATDLSRVCVAGGDTSGTAVSALDVTALEALAPIASGAPLCRATTSDPVTEGLEVAFKGGQTGNEAFFTEVRDGGVPSG
jgi:uncharacterized protein YgbK (DUF1537 family)